MFAFLAFLAFLYFSYFSLLVLIKADCAGIVGGNPKPYVTNFACARKQKGHPMRGKIY